MVQEPFIGKCGAGEITAAGLWFKEWLQIFSYDNF